MKISHGDDNVISVFLSASLGEAEPEQMMFLVDDNGDEYEANVLAAGGTAPCEDCVLVGTLTGTNMRFSPAPGVSPALAPVCF